MLPTAHTDLAQGLGWLNTVSAGSRARPVSWPEFSGMATLVHERLAEHFEKPPQIPMTSTPRRDAAMMASARPLERNQRRSGDSVLGTGQHDDAGVEKF